MAYRKTGSVKRPAVATSSIKKPAAATSQKKRSGPSGRSGWAAYKTKAVTAKQKETEQDKTTTAETTSTLVLQTVHNSTQTYQSTVAQAVRPSSKLFSPDLSPELAVTQD
jgi:hypothetical protein